jgi:phosphoribosylaminoimidazole (AIR) synthetase
MIKINIKYKLEKPKKKVLEKILYWVSNDGNYIINFCYNNGVGMIKKVSKKHLKQIKEKYKNKLEKANNI